jgi:hypothetical protein
MHLSEFVARCEPYFDGDGLMVEQPYQERIGDGMIRVYLTHQPWSGSRTSIHQDSVRRRRARRHPASTSSDPTSSDSSRYEKLSKLSGFRRCSACST